MPRRRKSGRLSVFLNSRVVGQLTREASGAVDFRYDPAWPQAACFAPAHAAQASRLQSTVTGAEKPVPSFPRNCR